MSKEIVWFTGASTGIGEATALELAARGYTVAVTARSEDKLIALAEKNPNIKSYPGDVTQPQKIAELVNQIETDLGPIQMAVLNAGTYFPDSVEEFKAATIKKQYEINVMGVMYCIEPVLEKFKRRGKGQICITSSVAGYRGLPKSMGYGSSKAALINFAEALAAECKELGIKVQVCCPGFVRTPLTDKNDFPMPMLMEVEDAAEAYADGLESNQFEITFPWAFTLLTKLFGLLPNRAYIWAIAQIKKKQRG